MAFNLANERIQDTYEQLVQISGSTLVNGIGTVIPAITNINSVSSSYAITASYAEYAVSASHEIVHEVSSSYAETASFANFATSAGTSTSATTSTSASHALYADQAGTATSAITATTASYIDPTFISASAAASGFGSGGGDPFPYTGSAVISGSLEVTGSIKVGNGLGFPVPQTATLDGRSLRVQQSSRFTELRAYGTTTLTSSVLTIRDQGGFLIFEPTSTINNGLALLSGPDSLTNNAVNVGPVNTTMSKPLQMLNNSAITASGISATSAVISGSLKTTGSLSIYNYYDDGFAEGTSSVFEVNTEGPGLGKQTAIKVSNRDSLFSSPLVDMRSSEVSVNSLSLPGNGTISFSGSANGFSIQSLGENLTIRAKDVLTLQAQRTTGTIRLFGGAYAVLTGTQTSLNLGSTTEPGPTPQITITSSGHHTFRFGASGSFTGSFSGNGSGLTNINTAFGAELYYNAADYVIDLPGDANDAAYTVSISQSGVYLISASKVPPYAANGPRVNLQWCPQQLGSGVAKVKFFVPALDTGIGITYKQSVSCSADYQYIWNSTTTPSGSTSSTIARSLTLPQYSNGAGVTNMIKGQDGFVYFSTTGTPVPSQGYIYTGPSIGLLV